MDHSFNASLKKLLFENVLTIHSFKTEEFKNLMKSVSKGNKF